MDPSAHQSKWQIGEVVFGVPFLIGVILNLAVPAALYPAAIQPAGIAAGVVVIFSGLALISAARRELGRYRQPTDPGQPTTGLVTTGVFESTRNPLYLAAVLVFAGLAIALNFLWALLSVIAGVIACHFVLIAPEERYLAARFGDGYEQYRKRVNRWFGSK